MFRPFHMALIATAIGGLNVRAKYQTSLYNLIYPTSEDVPKLYGSHKIQTREALLSPIVSSHGSVTNYNTSKHLAVMLNSVIGKNRYTVKNAEDFSNKVRNRIIPLGYEHASFDVSFLFTCIPVY